MNITIGAKGYERKSLNELVKVEGLPLEVKMMWQEKIRKATHNPKMGAIIGFSIPLLLLASGLPPLGITHAMTTLPQAVPAMAMPEALKSTILHSFDPLINLVQALAYPIAGLMIVSGCLFMFFNREKGITMLQNAAIGYLLVQLAPLFLKLLVGIGSSI